MTIDELKALKTELDELVALRENLASTQQRCTELLLENRRLNRELAQAKEHLDECADWYDEAVGDPH